MKTKPMSRNQSRNQSRNYTLTLALLISCPTALMACEPPPGAPVEIVSLAELCTRAMEGIGLVPVIKSESPKECENGVQDCR